MRNIPEDVHARAVDAFRKAFCDESSTAFGAAMDYADALLKWADEQHGQVMMELAKEIERLREELDEAEREKSEIEEWHEQSRLELENLRQAYAAFQREHMA